MINVYLAPSTGGGGLGSDVGGPLVRCDLLSVGSAVAAEQVGVEAEGIFELALRVAEGVCRSVMGPVHVA